MENASKAIVIAGSILIGIIVITVFYSVYRSTSEIIGVNSENTSQAELKDFNTSYEAYNKKLMYGVDIISLLNKAIDNNRKYDILYGPQSNNQRYKDYYVDIEFTVFKRNDSGQKIASNGGIAKEEKLAEKITYSLSQNYTEKNHEIYDLYISKAGTTDDDAFRGFKFSGFKCTKVEYVKQSKDIEDLGAVGRVCKMTFEEIWG